MRSDTDSGIERTLTSVANLIDHANKRARRSVQFAQAGDHENAMNLALEIESLLKKQPTCSRLPLLLASKDKTLWTAMETERIQSETSRFTRTLASGDGRIG
jgi:hypothetical protein